MGDPTATIIAAAAKAQLAPLGFRRKGRSRLWFADRGWWLNVVEFTPGRWTKSISLMNAAHWLWLDVGFLSFNEAVSSNCHADFENEGQFTREVGLIASRAREKAMELDARFSSFEAVAEFVIARARSSPDRMGPSWWGYEAGIASALIGERENAHSFFAGVTAESVIGRASLLSPLVDRPSAFRSRLNEFVSQGRGRMKLKPSDIEFF